MNELQKEAALARQKSIDWANSDKTGPEPEAKDDFVARVIDKVCMIYHRGVL